jgi:hypothetical protein
MAYPLLSTAWVEAFKERWNANEEATEGTGDLAGVLELMVADGEGPPVQMRITPQGTVDYAGPQLDGERARFRFIGSAESWRKLGTGEYTVVRSLRGPIYMQGSMLTLLGSFPGLCAAMSEVGNVPTEGWS